ncbi:MAG: hypothetical protein QOE59_838, partial [Actinomycetota bacterium]|nr:hypothetical protein [Actinomycetota bacterium]
MTVFDTAKLFDLARDQLKLQADDL